MSNQDQSVVVSTEMKEATTVMMETNHSPTIPPLLELNEKITSSKVNESSTNEEKKKKNRSGLKRSHKKTRKHSPSSTSSDSSYYSSSSSSGDDKKIKEPKSKRQRRHEKIDGNKREKRKYSNRKDEKSVKEEKQEEQVLQKELEQETGEWKRKNHFRNREPSPRQLERERQNKEREERRKKGLATTTPKFKSNETTEEIIAKVRDGGIYIPPFKLRKVQQKINDKKSIEYQRMNWDTLKKSINGLINKVSVTNITNIIPELFAENLVRGRGLFCRAIMKAQTASPSFSHIYAALLAVINTRMPELGELVLKRLIVGFRKSYQRNDKIKCISYCKFIAHLVNQQVVHELLAGQMLMLLLETPTDDSVELAVNFMKECGQVLNSLAPKIVHAIFERFRSILHEGEIDKRVQFMIEGLFVVRKTDFEDFPGVIPALDLVENDQITHELNLDDKLTPENQLDYFHYDPDFEENEETYKQIKREILGESSDEEADDEEEEAEDEDAENHEFKAKEQEDKTSADSVTAKRTIYLTIMSSVNFEECANKLIRTGLCQGKEMEVCSMIIECCSQERTYIRYFGLLAQRFCQLQKIYQEKFEECFKIQYSMIHRLETNRLRNVAKLFSHLLTTDAISWAVMEHIQVTESETTSSSRIFVKHLFQDLAELMGMPKLIERLKDEYLKDHYKGLFPTDTAKNTRFAINFWSLIGLGALTEDLREHLKNAAKMVKKPESPKTKASSTSSDSSDSSDSSSSEDESSSSSSSDESDSS